jgi:NAD(P)H-flavin reductase
MVKNDLIPEEAVITLTEELNPEIKLFNLRLSSAKKPVKWEFYPGQFVMVGINGFGEAPFSICSNPFEKNFFQIAVRKVGQLTEKLFSLKFSDKVTIRGPFGNGFPMGKLVGQNIIFISGGCGLAALRSLILFAQEKRTSFEQLFILYGAKTPQELIFRKEFPSWQTFAELKTTVDQPDITWNGNTGLVSNLLDQISFNGKNAFVLLCGPPRMYQSVIEKLLDKKVKPQNILASLERRMRCGVGRCQHCVVGTKYTCTDGPIFSYQQILELQGAV